MLIYMYNFVGLKHILIKLLHYLVSLATSLGIKAIRLLKFAFKLYTSNKDYRGDRSSVAGSPHLSEACRQFSVPVNIQCSQDVD